MVVVLVVVVLEVLGQCGVMDEVKSVFVFVFASPCLVACKCLSWALLGVAGHGKSTEYTHAVPARYLPCSAVFTLFLCTWQGTRALFAYRPSNRRDPSPYVSSSHAAISRSAQSLPLDKESFTHQPASLPTDLPTYLLGRRYLLTYLLLKSFSHILHRDVSTPAHRGKPLCFSRHIVLYYQYQPDSTFKLIIRMADSCIDYDNTDKQRTSNIYGLPLASRLRGTLRDSCTLSSSEF